LGTFVFVNSFQEGLTAEDDDPVFGTFNDIFEPWTITTVSMFYPNAIAPDPMYADFHGKAKGRIKYHINQVPEAEGVGLPGQGTSSITATLFGHDVSANVTVLLYRWATVIPG